MNMTKSFILILFLGAYFRCVILDAYKDDDKLVTSFQICRKCTS